MAGNRKAFEKVILYWLARLDKTNDNVEFYRKHLASLSDAQIDAMAGRLERMEEYIYLKIPNFKERALTFEELLAIGDEMGYKFFERVWITDRATGITMLSNHEYMILVLPERRQSQSLMGKMSVAEDNSHIDTLTNQPTGDSKTSSLSFIETQVLANQGVNRPLEELLSSRGGNLKALARLEQQFLDQCSASLDAPGMHEGKVKSLQNTATYLKAMHLDNNIDQ